MTESNVVHVPSPIQKSRILKMAYNKVPKNDGTKTMMPAIKFSGQYLEVLGFKVGGFFELIINDDHSLTIKVVGGKNEKRIEEAHESTES